MTNLIGHFDFESLSNFIFVVQAINRIRNIRFLVVARSQYTFPIEVLQSIHVDKCSRSAM